MDSPQRLFTAFWYRAESWPAQRWAVIKCEGQPCTWRTRLIKVAARVRQTSRRVLVELSASWPYLGYFHRVAQRVLPSPPLAANSSYSRANSKLPASAAQSPLGGKGGGLYLVSSHPP